MVYALHAIMVYVYPNGMVVSTRTVRVVSHPNGVVVPTLGGAGVLAVSDNFGPDSQQDRELIGAGCFYHVVLSPSLRRNAQAVHPVRQLFGNLGDDFGDGVARDELYLHRCRALFVLGEVEADRRVVSLDL